jgi:hypothetical protein
VTDPLFWLGLSLFLVAVCLAVAMVMAIPALLELGRASRSVEKLADTLRRELPPTLEAIRLTGLEITDLTDEISSGVQNAGNIARQVDQSIGSARSQVRDAQVTTRSFVAGVKAAWRSWLHAPSNSSERRRGRGGSRNLLPTTARQNLDLRSSYPEHQHLEPEQLKPDHSVGRQNLHASPEPDDAKTHS